MILWTIAWVLTIIFLALLVLMWFRKIQFDAIHQNFLDLEDEFGGRVIRSGFAARPKFAGAYKGKNFLVSITTEGGKEERRYYIGIRMDIESNIIFSILSTDWLGKREFPKEQKRETVPVQNGAYLLETTGASGFQKKRLARLEDILAALPPVAYILTGKNQMLLERITRNLVQDTKIEAIRPLLEGMYNLKKALQ